MFADLLAILIDRYYWRPFRGRFLSPRPSMSVVRATVFGVLVRLHKKGSHLFLAVVHTLDIGRAASHIVWKYSNVRKCPDRT